PHIEEGYVLFPPRFVFLTQGSEALSAVLNIALDELQTGFLVRQRRSAHVNAQHVAKPQILTYTLMHHLFVHATAPRIAFAWPHRKIVICELTPDTAHL